LAVGDKSVDNISGQLDVIQDFSCPAPERLKQIIFIRIKTQTPDTGKSRVSNISTT
jgi:hypothetical protein